MAAEKSPTPDWITSTPTVLGGKPRVKNRRLGVHFLATQVIDGEDDPEVVADRYDVPVEAVRAAVSYYYEHSEEMEDINRRRGEVLEEARNNPSVPTTPEELADLASGAQSASD